MLKYQAVIIGAGLALIQLGIAVADVDPVATDPSPTVPAPVSDRGLVESSENALGDVVRSVDQLRRALQRARTDQDLILATCLRAKLEEIDAVLADARRALEGLRAEADPTRAQRLHVIISVYINKIGVTLEEAALCIGADGDSPQVFALTIEPPHQDVPDNPFAPIFEEGGAFGEENAHRPPRPEEGPLAIPPPALPIDIPPIPAAASPTR